MPENEYLLKVFSGPNQGAEVALSEGELLIGSGRECDLILSDALIAAEQVKLIIGADGSILLLPLASPIYVNGQEIPLEGAQTLEPFQFVSLGTTHFIIGPVEGEWPPLSAADIPELKKMEKPKELAEGEEEGAAEGEDGGGQKSESGEEEEIPADDPRKKMVVFGSAGVLVFLILVCMVILFLWKDDPVSFRGVQDGEGSQEVVHETIEEKIESALQDTGLMRYVTVRAGKDGRTSVEGWLEKNDEKELLESSLAPYGQYIDLRVYSQEAIMDSVQDVINMLKLSLKVHSMELGKIRIEGYVGDPVAWQKTKDEIERDIPGIKYLKDEVYTADRIYPLLGKALMDSGLSDKIEVVPQKGTILLRGLISKEEIPMLKQAMVHFQSQMGFAVPIQNNIKVEEADKIYLDAEIDSVMIGEGGVVVTKDGQRLFKGGVLKGGYTIQDITREGIFLQKGEQKITLKIGEE